MAKKKDITQTGPKPLRGIRNPDLYTTPNNPIDIEYGDKIASLKREADEALYRNYNAAHGHLGYESLSNPKLYKPYYSDLDYGSSKYDSGLMMNVTQEDINEQRANNQPWYDKIGAGLAKGAILAGTTFLEGTVGLIAGGVQAIAEGDASKIWDNSFNAGLQAFNEEMEKVLPNYYTQEELNSPWYSNIFTANFIGDKFIKNLGFSVGALYSGGVFSAGFKATRIPSLIAKITNSTKAAKVVTTAAGALASATTEGSIEAMNNSNEFKKQEIETLDTRWRDYLAKDYQPKFDELDAQLSEAYTELYRLQDSSNNGGIIDEKQKVEIAKAAQKVATLERSKDMLLQQLQYDYDNRAKDSKYKESLAKIEEDRVHFGNTNLLGNIGILTVSNLSQFSRFYGRGFSTAKRTSVKTAEETVEHGVKQGVKQETKELVEQGAKQEAKQGVKQEVKQEAKKAISDKPLYNKKEFSKGELGLRISKGAISEGTEEISQKADAAIMTDYYSTDVHNFVSSKIDPEAEQQALSWWKSTMSGINATINDGSSWEEFFIGALTGVLGVPTFRSIKSESGSFQLPIKMEGGAYNEYKEYKEQLARSEKVANYLNERVQSPEFLNYYRGLIRRKKYQMMMDNSVRDNDEFNYKNAEHAQLVSDIEMFHSAGRLDDLKAFINEALDTSDENLEAIYEATTSKDEKTGEYFGPFTDKKGTPLYATESGKKEMIDALTNNHKAMMDTIDNYVKNMKEIDVQTDGFLDDEQLSELTWLKSQIDNWRGRAKDMIPIVKQALKNVSETIQFNIDRFLTNTPLDEQEASERAAVSEELFKRLGISPKAVKTLQNLSNMKDKKLEAILTNPKNAKAVDSIIDQLDALGSNIIGGLDIDNIVSMMRDLPKIGRGIETYQKKLEEFLSNPEKLKQEQEEIKNKAAKKAQKQKAKNLKDAISSAQSVNEIRDIVDKADDEEAVNTALDELKDNPVVQNHKATKQYNNEIQKALSDLGLDSQTANDANTLWNEHYKNAENVEQLANPNSVHITDNDTIFDESSNGDVATSENRYNNAVYALQQAIHKVNNDAKFRDNFSPEFKAAPVAPTRTVSSTTTGNSGVSTTPSVNSNTNNNNNNNTPQQPRTKSPDPVPRGNISSEEVKNENKETNKQEERLPENPGGKKQYYRPVIPELHIEASKDGDFRKFWEVMKDQGRDYQKIYEYLEKEGAFDYLNNGNVKEGDAIGFMIDPEFESTMEGYDWYQGPTIFMVHGRNNQVVGSLDSMNTAPNYEGLTELITKIRDEFDNRNQWQEGDITTEVSSKDGITTTKFNRHRSDGKVYTGGGVSIDSSKITEDSFGDTSAEDLENIQLLELRELDGKYAGTIRAKVKDGGYTTFDVKFSSNPVEGFTPKSPSTGKFFATPQTRVSKMMVGRIPYGTEDRSLNDIPGVENGKFGIIQSNSMNTNSALPDSKVRKPVSTANKEGRLYLYIPNGAGSYSPIAVRVKHFNSNEFNLSDPTVANTPRGRQLIKAIEAVANSKDNDDLENAIRLLDECIYTGTLHINIINNKFGTSIQFIQTELDKDGYEIYENGKRKEKVEYAKLSKIDSTTNSEIPNSLEVSKNNIINALMSFNLPLQVSISSINKGTYNNDIIESNILTTNVIEAKVRGTWFTTDYFDENGKLQKAVNPVSRTPAPNPSSRTPVNGTESVVNGTTVTIGGNTYIVDVANMVYTDSTGTKHGLNNSNANIFATAWAEDKYGDITEAEDMTENKIVTPQGKVLDRTTGQFVDKQEETRIKNKLQQRNNKPVGKEVADKIVAEITENQEKVDKSRTDSDYYYILEEDGEYHPYDRIHKRLGSNWTQSPKQTAALKAIRYKLNEYSSDKEAYDKYLDEQAAIFGVDLSAFKGKTDNRSKDAIVNTIRDKMSNSNSQRALNAGSAIDTIIRDVFAGRTPTKPANITDSAFNQLLGYLERIKARAEARGETFLTDNIVLFVKYPDGTRIAGEVDILSVDKDGKFRIYDVKTSRYSFNDFVDSRGKTRNYFNNPGPLQTMSTRDYYTLQLSGYENLFRSQYGVQPAALGILPFVLSYGTAQSTTSDIPNGTQTKLGLPIGGNQGYFRTDKKVDDNEARFVSSDKNGKIYFKPILDTKAHEGTLKSTDSAKIAVEFVGGDPKEATSFVLVEPGEATKNPSNGRIEISKKAKVFAVTPSTPYTNTEGGISNDTVTTIVSEKGIPIAYDKKIANKVPLINKEAPIPSKPAPTNTTVESNNTSNKASSTTNSSNTDPVVNTVHEAKTPISKVTSRNKISDNDVKGYYIVDNKLYKGWLLKIGEINGEPIYITRQFVSEVEGLQGTYKKYNIYAVFKNGTTWKAYEEPIFDSGKSGKSIEDITNEVLEALNGNPARVKDISNQETILTKDTQQRQDNTPTNSAAQNTVTADKEANKLDTKRVRPRRRYRLADKNKKTTRSVEKELKWLDKVLPQLSKEDRVKLIQGLIEVAEYGPGAWGMFSDGIITLSDIAAEGTVYHEAFHVVFNMMLSEKERNNLLDEARKLYGDKDTESLEEDLAEGFRHYIAFQEERGLGRKILDFFKNLFAKVTNWKYTKPTINNYYRMISQGRYSKSKLNQSDNRRLRAEEYTSEMQSIKDKAIADGTFMKAPNGNPTNLNERQWLQVRTKNFINWFGDWINFDKKNPYNTDIKLGKPEANYDDVDAEGFGTTIPVYYKNTYIGDINLNDTYNNGDFEVIGKYVSMPEVANPVELEEEYRGKGYGKAMYFEFAKQVANKGKILRSATDSSRTPASTRVWESLVRDGYAKKVDNRYEIINSSLNNASKVVDENGEPLVVYHATKASFNIFDKSFSGTGSGNISNTEGVFYFAAHAETALDVFKTKTKKEKYSYNVMQVFLNIRNANIIPLEEYNKSFNNNTVLPKLLKNKDGIIGVPEETPEQIYERKLQEYNIKKENGTLGMFDRKPKSVNDFLEEQLDTVYVATNPNQIKSATSNNGEFSTTNDDIRFRLVKGFKNYRKSNNRNKPMTYWNTLTQEEANMLEKQGWTKEQFNRVSQAERDHAVECAGL